FIDVGDAFLTIIRDPLPVEAGGDVVGVAPVDQVHRELGRQRRWRIGVSSADVTYGRINLNTAPVVVLATLPGMNSKLLARIFESRRLGPSADPKSIHPSLPTNQSVLLTPVNPLEPARWDNLSDFILDEMIWEGLPLYDRLTTVDPFAQLVTTHSLTFRVKSANRVAEADDAAQPSRRPSLALAERLVAGDHGVVETVDFRFHAEGNPAGDPDLQEAKPVSAGAAATLRRAVTGTQAASAVKPASNLTRRGN
ncbi:MAG: helix-hairpin-helix domain-containing protein, partial [bacterium]|nr:helix-hairpin-helix domain-containing protein [bacterium]